MVALFGHTSPPDANSSTASPTPYWKYSTLLGGGCCCGGCDSWAEARFACPNSSKESALAITNGAAFLRRTQLGVNTFGFVVEPGSTFVVATGLTVPESFV